MEVLSPSTEDYDRGTKFEHYRTLPSLQEYLLISQDKIHIVHYVKQEDATWVLSETARPEDHVQLPSISCDLSVADIYAKVSLISPQQ